MISHLVQPLPADRSLGGGYPVLVGEIGGRDHRVAGEGVVAADDHSGEIAGQGGAGEVAGDRQRDVAPAVCDAEIGLPGRDVADGVPGFAFGNGDPQRS